MPRGIMHKDKPYSRSMPVDTALHEDSMNPVQNRVLAKKIDTGYIYVANTNLNNLTEYGRYAVDDNQPSTANNFPSTAAGGILLVEPVYDGSVLKYVKQTYTTKDGANVWERTFNGTAWTGWKQIYGKRMISGTAISGVTSIASNAYVNIASINLTQGTYIVRGTMRFESNTNGHRGLSIHSTSQWGGTENLTNPINGAQTPMRQIKFYELSNNTTLYLIAHQTSGITLAIDSVNFQAFKLT